MIYDDDYSEWQGLHDFGHSEWQGLHNLAILNDRDSSLVILNGRYSIVLNGRD